MKVCESVARGISVVRLNPIEIHIHWFIQRIYPYPLVHLTGAYQGMDGNGGMGLSLIIMMDHSLIPYV